jgi:crotonobetainyl-CoA:carnitine CoA-transferase CaiB-like acyl-CoA transferase
MAALTNSAGHYSQYPGAFGDTVAGSNLTSGIVSGLRQRFTNGGLGCYLETSLLRAGMWVMSPHLLRCATVSRNLQETKVGSIDTVAKEMVKINVTNSSSQKITSYRHADDRRHCTGSLIMDICEMNDVYVSKDRKRFFVLELNSNVEIVREKYSLLLQEICSSTHMSLRSFASKNDFENISVILQKINIKHRLAPVLKGAPSLDKKLYLLESKSLIKTDLTPDNKLWVRSPFDFSCSNQHNILHRRAPELGAHTRSIIEHDEGFRERAIDDPAIVPRIILTELSNISHTYVQPMSNVLVIEIPFVGTAVSAAAALCCDDGAVVYQLLVDGVHPMAKIDPHFIHQFQREKKQISIASFYEKDVIPAIEKLMDEHSDKCIVILHNLSTCPTPDAVEFAKYNGICHSFQKKHSDVIVVDVSSSGGDRGGDLDDTGGNGTNEIVTSDLGAYFGDGFLSYVLGDDVSLPYAPIFQFGEMISSIHVKTAIDLALFHLVRTSKMNQKKEGNLVELNLTRCGVYSNLMFSGMSQVNPEMGVALDKMSFDSFVSSDGQWFQLLGVDYKVHVPRVFKALKIGYSSAIKRFFSSLNSISSPMQLIPVMFYEITHKIREKMIKMSYKETIEVFQEHDVWYTTVASPEQAITNEQAILTRTFRWKEGIQRHNETMLVNSPCQMSIWNNGEFEYGNCDSCSSEY